MNVDLMAIISQIPMITIFDYLSVVIGAITGTLYAIDRTMDALGAAALGLATGFGGGIIRDVLLRDQGIFFMEHPLVILVCICISMVMSLNRRHLKNIQERLFYIDAFSMAWFAVAGASKSWSAGVGVVISIFLGGVTAVGGGIIRDICAGETPRVFLPSKFYGVSSLVGSMLYVFPTMLGAAPELATVLCVGSCFALTALSERFNWRTHGDPEEDDCGN